MATCFIIGAAGKVGTHLTKQLCARQHAVSALHRKPEQAEAITVVGATPIMGDLQKLSVETLAQKMTGHEVVIFSAGRVVLALNSPMLLMVRVWRWRLLQQRRRG